MVQSDNATPSQLPERLIWSPDSVAWHCLFNPTDRRTTLQRLAVLEGMQADRFFRSLISAPRGSIRVTDLEAVLWRFSESDPQLWERLIDVWAVTA